MTKKLDFKNLPEIDKLGFMLYAEYCYLVNKKPDKKSEKSGEISQMMLQHFIKKIHEILAKKYKIHMTSEQILPDDIMADFFKEKSKHLTEMMTEKQLTQSEKA